jgi:tetrahydrofolate dehydrogenase/cyclohydrolase, NAD(P)-binding domain protein
MTVKYEIKGRMIYVKLDKSIIMKHNLYEKHQNECLQILKKYKPRANVTEYNSTIHDYILKVATEEDLKFYKDRPRGNLISCRYIASKIDNETEVNMTILQDLFDLADSYRDIELHLLKTDDKNDTISFIKGIEKKLNKLGIKIKVIDIKRVEDVCKYTKEYKDEVNPFVVLKPLNKELLDNEDKIKVLLRHLENYKLRDIDGYLSNYLDISFSNIRYQHSSATIAAVVEIFNELKLESKPKSFDYTNVLVIGQSNHLGKPLANLLESQKYPVYTVDSRTSKYIKQAVLFSSDVVISVTGNKEVCSLFNPSFISTNEALSDRIIIDIGIINDNGKIRGDIQNAIKAQYFLSNTVPNGIGLIDTSIIALRTVKSYFTQLRLKGEILNDTI